MYMPLLPLQSINSNLHNVTIPDFGTFKVLHENDIAGPGWTVIQQWTNGGEDEQRDWEEYKNGFGDYEGDLFIGLEKIHRLTSDKPHELYIHMEECDGDTLFAHYNNFRIAGEGDKYRLITLGLYSGNAAEDGMIWHEHKHSSLDSENDVKNFLHCLSRRNGGWWYDILTLYSW